MSGGQESEPNSWELNGLNSLDLWDYTIELECLRGGEDLQLAAELGKTLLERNKELETALRQHQNVIEDQAQEIEYLTKQTAALREVNDSRLRIYEQLEVSIQDLERTNHRLALDHSADKKHVKSLTATIESLEVKCDDFQKTIEDLTSQLDIYKRKTEKLSDTMRKEVKHDVTSEPAVVLTPQKSTRVIDAYPTPPCTPDDVKRHEEILRLSDEIRENRVMLSQEQRRALELEEQLSSMVQENNRLQDQVRNWHRNQDEPKSMHEEFSILEEVRQGQVCVRCLRTTSDRAQDEMSSMMDAEEDDDRSGISSLCQLPCTGNGLQEVQEQRVHKLIEIKGDKERLLSITSSVDNNPYRELVEKYEALLEVQRSQVTNLRKNRKQPAVSVASLNNSAPLSLQEELQISGDYSQFSLKDTDEESGQGESGKVAINTKPIKPAENTTRKNFTRTPDLSEAETSSSGFADETSNKATQTEYDRPGSFLCTIADGEDCKFSIYDDGGNSIDSRFRNRPEYRELFKEIFTILKKAAENKDEGEKLPLLDDAAPAAKVPPVTPAAEDPPGDFTDDTQSVLSSAMSEQSINLSDITPPEGKENVPGISYNASRKENQTYDDVQGTSVESSVEPQKVLTPLVRQPLDYFTGSPHLRKKGSKNRNRKHSQERQICESPIMPSQPKVVQVKGTSRRKRDYRPLESSPLTRTPQENAVDWNGSTMQFYNRSINSPTPSGSGKSGKVYQGWNPETNSWDIKQSTASQEIHKLKRLELSYAEVLRNADKTKTRRRRHQ